MEPVDHPAPTNDAVADAPAPPTGPPRSSAGLWALLVVGLVVGACTLAAWFISRATGPLAEKLVRYWPFVVLVVSVGVIITLITVARMHAFLALVTAAIGAGLMSLPGALVGPAAASGGIVKPAVHHVMAVSMTAFEFGKAAGNIGIVIGLASIIGVVLLESGSADKVVRRFLAAFGEKRAGFALLLATYVVSIPIFFDTIFMLLVPIAQALWLRTRKDYLLYVLAICCAGVITHSMVIPHPGPLAMATDLKVDVGLSIIMGLATGVVPLLIGWLICRWLNSSMVIEPPASAVTTGGAGTSLDIPEDRLPSFLAAITPIILPVLLISLASVMNTLSKSWSGATANWFVTLNGVSQFFGDRHIALIIGVIIAIAVLMRQKGIGLGKLADMLGPPLETAGIIILITAAGGAFGAMLRNAGVGDAIKSVAAGSDISLILLAYVVALVIRIAQGSATVAMLTTAAMIFPMMSETMAAGQLPYHPIYLFLAIGYGAFGVSWMNDSGFWVVSRLGGLSERQALRSWTVLLTVNSLVGLATTLVLSKLVPMRLPIPG